MHVSGATAETFYEDFFLAGIFSFIFLKEKWAAYEHIFCSSGCLVKPFTQFAFSFLCLSLSM